MYNTIQVPLWADFAGLGVKVSGDTSWNGSDKSQQQLHEKHSPCIRTPITLSKD